MTENKAKTVTVDDKEYKVENLPEEVNLHLNRIVSLRSEEIDLAQKLLDIQVALNYRENEVRKMLKESGK